MSAYQVWQCTTSASSVSLAIARLRWKASSAPRTADRCRWCLGPRAVARGRAGWGLLDVLVAEAADLDRHQLGASSRLRYSTCTPAPPYTCGGYSLVNSATLPGCDTAANLPATATRLVGSPTGRGGHAPPMIGAIPSHPPRRPPRHVTDDGSRRDDLQSERTARSITGRGRPRASSRRARSGRGWRRIGARDPAGLRAARRWQQRHDVCRRPVQPAERDRRGRGRSGSREHGAGRRLPDRR